jgi:putative flippase GtrA
MSNRLVQLCKFGLVGALNTAVDFLVFTLLTAAAGMGYMASQFISYSCGVLNSYLLNRSWTFRGASKPSGREIFRFIAVNLAALATASVILNWLYGLSSLPLVVCKLVATVASVAINYAGSRYWVFGSRTTTGSEPS